MGEAPFNRTLKTFQVFPVLASVGLHQKCGRSHIRIPKSNRNLRSGLVDKQLLTSAILLPHDQVLAASLLVVPPETDAGVVTARMCLRVCSMIFKDCTAVRGRPRLRCRN